MVEKGIDGRPAILGNDLLCGSEIWATKGEQVTLLTSFMSRKDGTCWVIQFCDGRRTSVADYEITIDKKVLAHN